MKIEIEIPKGCKAEWVNGVLTLVKNKKEDLRPVTERVKTFEDAVSELGEAHPLCVHYREMYDNFLFEGGDAVSDIVAYLKLRIITAALNEGWTPKFVQGEYRYSVYFVFYGKEEWDDLSADTKRKRGVLLSGYEQHGACVRCGVETSFCFASHNQASGSHHLCFKNRDLALYAGKQFASLWLDFCYLPNTECKPYFSL